ncbi:MAG: sulfatase-like hydrolase/transferase [Planctomycetes bacterium]|nr:sulfatase-like hydrolase/transferase [Planctomycetota bacterium]
MTSAADETASRRRRMRRRAVVVLGLVLMVTLGVAVIYGRPWNRFWGVHDRQIDWNVVLVTFDTTRADHLGCYGAHHAETPTIDQMAQNGIRFESCYAPTPLTLPSHTSILTGLYPFRHNIHDNGTGPLDENAITLAEVLRGHGYATGAVLGAYVLSSRYGLNDGFDFYEDDFSGPTPASKFDYAQRNAQAVTDIAIKWLDSVADSRFFLWAHYFDPHAPYAPPGYDPATPMASAYGLEITYADSQLERLLAHVGTIQHATGRYTLLVFTADHGESLWNHGEPSHGLFVYNDTIRVPLIIADPTMTMTQRGQVVQEPVSLVDVFPTILKRLGIPLPHEIDGRPLPLGLEEAGESPATKRPIYFESYLPLYTYGWSPLEGIVLATEKYIRAPRSEFYDLAVDAHEQTNLFDDGDPRVIALQEALGDLKNQTINHPKLDAATLDLDEESMRALQTLGYLGVSIEPASDDTLPDPKDQIELHRAVLEAQDAISQGEITHAVALLKSVVDADPGNARVMFLLMDLLNDPQVGVEVAELLQRAAQRPLLPPLDLYIPMKLGISLGNDGRFAEAEQQLRKAAEAYPLHAAAHFNLARTIDAQQRSVEEVLPILERATKLEPGNLEYISAWARALERGRQYDRAIQAYDRVLELDANDVVALNNSAWCRYKADLGLETALQRSEKAVAIQPQDPHLRHTLASVLLALDRASEAISHLQRAIKADPEYAGAHYLLGVTREAEGDLPGAASALQRAINLAGDSTPEWIDDARSRLAMLTPS